MDNNSLDVLSKELMQALALILRAREKRSYWLLKEKGLTDQQLSLLRLIREHPSACVRQLADRLYVDPVTASGILDRLLAKQLILQHPVEADRRKRAFSLTAIGVEALIKNATPVCPEFRAKLGAVPEWELHMMAAGLRHLAELMSPKDSVHKQTP